MVVLDFSLLNPNTLSAVSLNVERLLADENECESTSFEQYYVLAVFHESPMVIKEFDKANIF